MGVRRANATALILREAFRWAKGLSAGAGLAPNHWFEIQVPTWGRNRNEEGPNHLELGRKQPKKGWSSPNPANKQPHLDWWGC